ncbi:unnamed protein product [Pseudo-nitzschia multistriata]|uniref:Uncharacterized protein n=1 Tax=Pseudo-nitzschia multistriata TaxID=183589 RepID=A0A448ZJJ7_9STRA|nr:unnamed protein product [Pseudo-nitzschia multistriata]
MKVVIVVKPIPEIQALIRESRTIRELVNTFFVLIYTPTTDKSTPSIVVYKRRFRVGLDPNSDSCAQLVQGIFIFFVTW